MLFLNFELAPKAVIKSVFSKSCCYYCNLLGYKKDNNMLTNSWAVFWYHDCSSK